MARNGRDGSICRNLADHLSIRKIQTTCTVEGQEGWTVESRCECRATVAGGFCVFLIIASNHLNDSRKSNPADSTQRGLREVDIPSLVDRKTAEGIQWRLQCRT